MGGLVSCCQLSFHVHVPTVEPQRRQIWRTLSMTRQCSQAESVKSLSCFHASITLIYFTEYWLYGEDKNWLDFNARLTAHLNVLKFSCNHTVGLAGSLALPSTLFAAWLPSLLWVELVAQGSPQQPAAGHDVRKGVWRSTDVLELQTGWSTGEAQNSSSTPLRACTCQVGQHCGIALCCFTCTLPASATHASLASVACLHAYLEPGESTLRHCPVFFLLSLYLRQQHVRL
jgi:hypothetical protein